MLFGRAHDCRRADGVVDIDDLNAVRNHFGAGAPAPAHSVPEPGALILALFAGVVCAPVLARRR